ncbi:MAG: MotA/TolQ/ExbB proton channel [Capsulimonas sp.]|nr:MotA/TolQ/ExbB proton channel [Capsulimonas sp.]
MDKILHFIHAGGFIMVPLLLLSIAALAVIGERIAAFSQFGDTAPGLLDKTMSLCRAGKDTEALQACEGRRGPVAACLSVVLRHAHQPVREVERVVEETGQDHFIRLERFLPVLDTATTIAPLMGLLGTILGMIGAFNAIAAQQHSGSSDAVLGGVSEALYATATGLIIAVVCFVAYNYFAARLRTVTAETEQAATKLINVLVERRHQSHAEHANLNGDAPMKEDTHGIQATPRA